MARAAKNPETGLTDKQERFCFEYIQNGGNASAAYRVVYSSKGTEATISRNAKALMDNTIIATRIAGLRTQVVDAAMDDASVDKSWVLKRLKTVAQRCLQADPVLDRKGNPVLVESPVGELVPAFTFDASGANRALQLLGQEIGMFIERKEEGPPGAFEAREVIEARIRERNVRLGLAKVLPPSK